MSEDDSIKLFEKQKTIYPRKVKASKKYRKIKWLTMLVLLGIYYLSPWVRWDRGQGAPDQAILIDLTQGRGYFFFLEIWPQEVYYLTGILILAAVGLFFVTSLFGRVWCGYTCPQTVWTDLFIYVEELIQGDRNQRIKLDNSKTSFEKIWKKTLTHIIWLIIGMLTGGAWVLYFTDAPTLANNVLNGEIPTNIAIWVGGLTISTYIMAGYARDQVCAYMCPYARFQSAMFDKDSLIIAYDEQRGEKRGKHKATESWEGRGHCIDCSMCVQVCPMGIDIRDGLQMECIACGLCIDACNDVMDKVDLPHGLIRYDTTHNKEARLTKDKEERWNFVSWRSLWYTLIIAVVGGIMLYSLATRATLEINAIHDRNPVFVLLSDGSIRNGYNIKILNKTHKNNNYTLSFSGIEDAEIKIQAAGDVSLNSIPVTANSVASYKIFVTSKTKPTKKRVDIEFSLKNNDNENRSSVSNIFISGN